jgi:Protein of unknown function (DUF3592)
MTFDEVIFPLIELVICGTPTTYLLSLCWLGIISRYWASTTGHITHSIIVTIDHKPNEACYYVRYEYEVRGCQYASNRVQFGGAISTNLADVRATTQCYRKDKEVTVFYHPRHPKVSTLERKVSGHVFAWLPIGLFISTALIGALLGWWE